MLFSNSLLAMNAKAIPDSLLQWQDWVLYDQNELNCPKDTIKQNSYCIWPGKLQLVHDQDLDKIFFTYPVTVYGLKRDGAKQRQYRVELPGNNKLWPQNVSINQSNAIVLDHNQQPFILLAPGKYELKGEFVGIENKQSLQLPQKVILLEYFAKKALERQNKLIEKKDYYLDPQNVLWFEKPTQKVKKTVVQESDKIEIKVFRRLIDDIPARIDSHYRLSVSGQRREVIIDSLFPDDFVAHSYSSQVPARLLADKKIALQLMPGVYTFNVTARALKPGKVILFFSSIDSKRNAC